MQQILCGLLGPANHLCRCIHFQTKKIILVLVFREFLCVVLAGFELSYTFLKSK